jgi:hypothetical protein
MDVCLSLTINATGRLDVADGPAPKGVFWIAILTPLPRCLRGLIAPEVKAAEQNLDEVFRCLLTAPVNQVGE